MWRNLLWFSRKKRKYESLKDSESADVSVSLGVESLVIFAVSIVAIIGAYFGGKSMVDGYVGAVILLVSAMAEALLFITGMYCAVLQSKLNGKLIGKTSIILQILALIVFVVVVVIAIK